MGGESCWSVSSGRLAAAGIASELLKTGTRHLYFARIPTLVLCLDKAGRAGESCWSPRSNENDRSNRTSRQLLVAARGVIRRHDREARALPVRVFAGELHQAAFGCPGCKRHCEGGGLAT